MSTWMRYGWAAVLLAAVTLLPGCFSGDLRLGELLLSTPTPMAMSATASAKQTPNAVPTAIGLTPYGRILFAQTGQIWVWQDGSARPITEGGTDTQAAWAPDGQRIAYVARGENSSDLYTLRVDTGRFEQLTAYRASRSNVWVFKPAWSPDGRLLSFLSDLGASDMSLWALNASGGGRRQLAATGWRGGIDSYGWSPDATQLAIGGFRSEQQQIWLYTPATGRWQQLTNAREGAYDPQFAPDGGRIAYVAREGGRHNIFTISVDGSNLWQVTDDGGSRSPVWSPDGEYIAFLSTRSGSFDVWVTRSAPTSGGSRGAAALPLTRNQNVDARGGLSWIR